MSMLQELILVDTVLHMCHHVHLPLIAYRIYMMLGETKIAWPHLYAI